MQPVEENRKGRKPGAKVATAGASQGALAYGQRARSTNLRLSQFSNLCRHYEPAIREDPANPLCGAKHSAS